MGMTGLAKISSFFLSSFGHIPGGGPSEAVDHNIFMGMFYLETGECGGGEKLSIFKRRYHKLELLLFHLWCTPLLQRMTDRVSCRNMT